MCTAQSDRLNCSAHSAPPLSSCFQVLVILRDDDELPIGASRLARPTRGFLFGEQPGNRIYIVASTPGNGQSDFGQTLPWTGPTQKSRRRWRRRPPFGRRSTDHSTPHTRSQTIPLDRFPFLKYGRAIDPVRIVWLPGECWRIGKFRRSIPPDGNCRLVEPAKSR